MATFTAIPEKTQTATAMKRVIDYVMQDKKTVIDGIKLVSGQNCVPESAYQEFMATKHQYGKANGVFFKQYVQSFKPNCSATPEQIHRIGLETAKLFDGFEVVIATHIDRDHWHNHFVVNSVNCETGYKIQINEKGLEELRHKSDEICQQFGLEILKPYQKPKQKSISQREYRTALRGDSKKLKLTNAIDYAVATSRNMQQFIDQMNKLGYGVKWIDHYKYITYTTPNGQRFRDNRLLDDKYLKTNMEELFAYGYEQFKTDKSDTAVDKIYGRSIDRTDTADVFDAKTGTVQSSGKAHFTDWECHCKKYGFDIQAADARGVEGNSDERSTLSDVQDRRYHKERSENDDIFSRGRIIQADGIFDESSRQKNIRDDVRAEIQEQDTFETQTEMDSDWGSIAVNTAYFAADLAMIGGGENDTKPEKKRFVRERKQWQKKKQNEQNQDNGFEMNM